VFFGVIIDGFEFGRKIPHLDRSTQCRIFLLSCYGRLIVRYQMGAGGGLEDRSRGNHGPRVLVAGDIDVPTHNHTGRRDSESPGT